MRGTALQTHSYDGTLFRAVRIKGEEWFVGKDAVRCLGIERGGGNYSGLHSDEVRVMTKGDLISLGQMELARLFPRSVARLALLALGAFRH